MKTQIKKLKLQLKELAKTIKEKKSHRKDRQPDGSAGSGYVSGLWLARDDFRHLHVAYCLLRGRTLEQVDCGKNLDMDRVNWIIKSAQPDSKEKLYVVVNETLTPSQQAVQAGHALAAFLKKYPNTMWNNGYLIYLKEKPIYNGNMACYSFLKGREYAEFIEPDMGDKITAYACFGYNVEHMMSKKILL
jgi:hypothetical protein